jgi:opacity protein-like surface antigen
MVARMSVVTSRLGLALALVVLCLNGRSAHAQANSVPYWTFTWPPGFGGSLTADQNSSPYGNLLGFNGSNATGGNFSSRYNFENGWFVGSERGGLGLGANGLGQNGAWGNLGSLSYEGMQFGYNFKNSELPVTIYAGFDTLKYNSGIGGPLAGFDSMSSTAPGYGVHAGVEFRPTSNLSLSLGVGSAQQPGGLDPGVSSFSLPAAAPFAFGGRR